MHGFEIGHFCFLEESIFDHNDPRLKHVQGRIKALSFLEYGSPQSTDKILSLETGILSVLRWSVGRNFRIRH